jgi:hypothetical protein
LEFGGTESDDITIAEQCGLHGLTVHGDQSVRRCRENDALPWVEFKRRMLIPDTIIIQLQIISMRAADTKRKTAGSQSIARLPARKDMELNHQKKLRGTWIWSPG